MSAYSKLKLYLERHEYKRGAYKGDAPADSSRRGKSHFRVVDRGNNRIAIKFHHTYIVTAHADGNLILDCDGWANSATTKEALQESFARCGIRAYVGSRQAFSKSHTCYINNLDGSVVYYDGMKIDSDGRVLSELKPFMRKQRDRALSTEFDAQLKASGFKDMFKLLHATCDPGDMETTPGGIAQLRQYLTEEVHTNKWKSIVANFTWDTEAQWNVPANRIDRRYIKLDASTAWSALTRTAKSDMYEEVPTDTFKL